MLIPFDFDWGLQSNKPFHKPTQKSSIHGLLIPSSSPFFFYFLPRPQFFEIVNFTFWQWSSLLSSQSDAWLCIYSSIQLWVCQKRWTRGWSQVADRTVLAWKVNNAKGNLSFLLTLYGTCFSVTDRAVRKKRGEENGRKLQPLLSHAHCVDLIFHQPSVFTCWWHFLVYDFGVLFTFMRPEHF